LNLVVAGTAKVRSGWMLADAARDFFPHLAAAPAAGAAAERVLADEALDLSLRRALVDSTDDLRRDLRVRDTFAGRAG
jgi:aminopeptidase N